MIDRPERSSISSRSGLRPTRPTAPAGSSLYRASKLDCDVCPLRDVLSRIGEHPINRVDDLLPWAWAARAGSVKLAA